MKEKPIIFKPEMVKAILEGVKTQTRRIINPQPEYYTGEGKRTLYSFKDGLFAMNFYPETSLLVEHSPYKPGDILWVREKHCNVNRPGVEPEYYYFADTLFVECEDYDPKEWTWKSPRYMKREAARLFLEVKSVRYERIQSISPEDCVAEGAVEKPHYMKWGGEKCLAIHKRYKKDYATLWDKINAKRGYPWESNPWVWVIEFIKIENGGVK